MRLVHEVGEAVELRNGRDLLFRYVYESGVDPAESPKPYFHPLRTLAGEEVTLFRPHDHPWHTGLAMTSANLSGEKFWAVPPSCGTEDTRGSRTRVGSGTRSGTRYRGTPPP